MSTQRGAVTYDGLPISSGGAHKLRTRGFLNGKTALQSFVDAVSLETKPKKAVLEVLEGPDVPSGFTAPLIARFNHQYPKQWTRSIAGHAGHQWDLPSNGLDIIAEGLDRLSPLPEAKSFRSVVLWVSWELRLFDAATGRALSHQSRDDYLGFETASGRYLGESMLRAGISETTTASLYLSLPYEIVEEAKGAARVLQRHFPARFSSKHWKAWTLTKAGKSYVGRKIPDFR